MLGLACIFLKVAVRRSEVAAHKQIAAAPHRVVGRSEELGWSTLGRSWGNPMNAAPASFPPPAIAEALRRNSRAMTASFPSPAPAICRFAFVSSSTSRFASSTALSSFLTNLVGSMWPLRSEPICTAIE